MKQTGITREEIVDSPSELTDDDMEKYHLQKEYKIDKLTYREALDELVENNTIFSLFFLQVRSIKMTEYTDLLRKHQTDLSKLDKMKEELIKKNLQELEELQKQCELNGGHISSNGFMYDICSRCGMMGT